MIMIMIIVIVIITTTTIIVTTTASSTSSSLASSPPLPTPLPAPAASSQSDITHCQPHHSHHCHLCFLQCLHYQNSVITMHESRLLKSTFFCCRLMCHYRWRCLTGGPLSRLSESLALTVSRRPSGSTPATSPSWGACCSTGVLSGTRSTRSTSRLTCRGSLCQVSHHP